MLRIRLTVTLLAAILIISPVRYRASSQEDTKTEEYAVYSAVVSRMSESEAIRLVVISENTVSYPVDAGFLRNEALARRLAPLSQVTVDDYIAKNRVVRPLSRGFDLKLPYVFFREEDEELFKPDGSWERYFKRFPDSQGFITLSSIGFNTEKNQAFLYAARSCGRLCGAGFMVVLMKLDGVWSVRDMLVRWLA
jgi:hypothetical protein